MKILQADGTLSTYNPLADGGLSIRFVTQEATDVDVSELHGEFFRQFGRLYFVVGDNAKPELRPPDTIDKKKSMSKRLRDAIWHLGVAMGVKQEDSEEYYRTRMAAFIAEIESEIEQAKGLPDE